MSGGIRWSEDDYYAWTQKQKHKKHLPQAEAKKPKRNKYGAKKTWVDGICFDSQKEAKYYGNLKLLCRAGALAGFLYHGKMVCTEGTDKDNRAVLYETDFVLLNPDGTYKIVDTKSDGTITQVFKNKMKSLREKYPDVEVHIE